MKKLKNNFYKWQKIVTIFISLLYVIAIIVVVNVMSSCSTTYESGARKIAPIVHKYDVKDIKYQTSHNVSPKD